MAELLDTVSKQLSSSIETKKGIAALLVSSADSEQRALEACLAMQAERDDYKRKYEDKCEEYEDLQRQLAEARALIVQLTQKPVVNVMVKGKAQVKKLITGDVHEIYGKDDNNTGQQDRRIGAGGQAHPYL